MLLCFGSGIESESVKIARDCSTLQSKHALSAVHVDHLTVLLCLHISFPFPAAQRKDTSLDAEPQKKGLTKED
jgi:hypothetical protein